MTIVPLVKVNLVGILEDKDKVLEATQEFGALHLIPLTSAQKELEAVPAGRGREASEALRWLLEPSSLHDGIHCLILIAPLVVLKATEWNQHGRTCC